MGKCHKADTQNGIRNANRDKQLCNNNCLKENNLFLQDLMPDEDQMNSNANTRFYFDQNDSHSLDKTTLIFFY